MLVTLAMILAFQGADPAPAKVDPPVAIQVLMVEQTSNGLPGQQGQERSTQELYVAKNMLRLRDRKSGVGYLFRIDAGKSQIWEISPDLKWYRSAAKFAQIQPDRDECELQMLKNSPDEALREYLKPGLERTVTVVSSEEEKEVLGYKVRRYVLKENDRVIIDALLTEEITAPGPFFEFYRHVGAFSDSVLERLQELKGVPLKASITVVTASLNYTIESVVKSVELGMYFPALFELPKGATESEETGPLTTCPMCGAEVETSGAPGGIVKDYSGKRLYFDKRACKKKWRELHPKKGPRKVPDPIKPAKKSDKVQKEN